MLASAVSAHAATEITYWLWDTNQLPAYKACAAEFQKQNPDITVKITQTAWSDYWTGISTGFVSGSAPDVFTDHLARYPEFALNDQLVDLAKEAGGLDNVTAILVRCQPKPRGLFSFFRRES